MPYEIGGRSDKRGNRYEIRVAVYYLLELLEEKIDSFAIETIGEDEEGIDLWIGHKNGLQEGIQCKGRNASKEYWDFSSANARGIFVKWKNQLDRNSSVCVSLASPLAFTFLEDLVDRAINTNNNGQDFYEYQVQKSSKEFIRFTNNVCKEFNINTNSDNDLLTLIDYLRRIKYRQFPDGNLKQIIFSRIEYLFSSNSTEIYDSMISWIFDGDILGKSISISNLNSFISEHKFKLKDLAYDDRVAPRINELNREYKKLFKPLDYGIIVRHEFEECKEAIDSEKSLIIHGRAGSGKSGCTENIIKYCEEAGITYLAIKLDKKVPSASAKKWGIDLGLPASISHCIHSISKNEKCVIILDQLDALRWTQSHSRDALDVCSEIINQVKILNYERVNKILMIFISRTYDLENDNNLKSIFNFNKLDQDDIGWKRILINELTAEQVLNIVGKEYLELTDKLKELLRFPSNLYIWEHLDKSINYNECSTANHLITQWWHQLKHSYFNKYHNEYELTQFMDIFVSKFEDTGRVYVPINLVSSHIAIFEYLSSNGFLVKQDNKVSFAHQSILDYFLADKMMHDYYSGISIIDIMGNKNNQTPQKRYQLQMLLQNLSEVDSQFFINAGLQLLDSETVRFSFKYVFFEVLNQINSIDSSINNFIIENYEGKAWSNHLLNDVIYSRVEFYRVLRNDGVLNQWFNNPDKKNIALDLLISVYPNYDAKDMELIREYVFKTKESAHLFSRCFYRDIYEDSDEMFELRMQFYCKYPMFSDNFVDFKLMIKKCEIRTIRYFAFLLENKIKKQEKRISAYEEEFLHENDEFLIENGMEVLNLLLPLLPKKYEEINSFSDWSCRYHKRSLERMCISIIKKACASIISENPESVYEILEYLNHINDKLSNEIILKMLISLPEAYSDFVISFLTKNFNNIVLDETSGNGDKLGLTKNIISKYSINCRDELFYKLEEQIIHYKDSHAKDMYKRRLEFNSQKNGNTVYWSFWGDLQYEMLKVLPTDKLSGYSKQLVKVLERKFNGIPALYRYSQGSFGSVSSPVTEKKLSEKNWKEIILSKNHKNRNEARWIDDSKGIVKSSREEFARSFNSVVAENPENMLELLLSIEEAVDDIFIDNLFSGISYSESLNNIDNDLIEKMILKYPPNYDSYRASSVCNIIHRKENTIWSEEILDLILDIAVNHHDPEGIKPNVTKQSDKEMLSFDMLFSNAINCVRGQAAEAIATLLWNNSDYFYRFKDTIDRIINDNNPAVRLSSMFILWQIYDIERDWAEDRILKLIEADYRFSGFPNMKSMFFMLYPRYRNFILRIIENCYSSDDEDLIKMGAYCIAEMYILKGEFEVEMTEIDKMSQKQAESVLEMVMLYFNRVEYNELTKNIICRFHDTVLDLEMPISRLFYDNLINLERDEEFLIKIMSSKLSRKVTHAFIHYLEEESRYLIEFRNIIFEMSDSVILGDIDSKERTWGIGESVSKLIIGLYDEASTNQLPKYKEVATKCLDIWDLMFENQIGSSRLLSQQIMQR